MTLVIKKHSAEQVQSDSCAKDKMSSPF